MVHMPIENPVVLANQHDNSHQKFQVPCQDYCQNIIAFFRTLIVGIRLQSCEQFL